MPAPAPIQVSADTPTPVLKPPVIAPPRAIAAKPIAVLSVPEVMVLPAHAPTAVLLAQTFEHKAVKPKAVLLPLVVTLPRAAQPIAVLAVPVEESIALQPMAVLPAVVQPKTIPSAVGVAATAIEVAAAAV